MLKQTENKSEYAGVNAFEEMKSGVGSFDAGFGSPKAVGGQMLLPLGLVDFGRPMKRCTRNW